MVIMMRRYEHKAVGKAAGGYFIPLAFFEDQDRLILPFYTPERVFLLMAGGIDLPRDLRERQLRYSSIKQWMIIPPSLYLLLRIFFSGTVHFSHESFFSNI